MRTFGVCVLFDYCRRLKRCIKRHLSVSTFFSSHQNQCSHILNYSDPQSWRPTHYLRKRHLQNSVRYSREMRTWTTAAVSGVRVLSLVDAASLETVLSPSHGLVPFHSRVALAHVDPGRVVLAHDGILDRDRCFGCPYSNQLHSPPRLQPQLRLRLQTNSRAHFHCLMFETHGSSSESSLASAEVEHEEYTAEADRCCHRYRLLHRHQRSLSSGQHLEAGSDPDSALR